MPIWLVVSFKTKPLLYAILLNIDGISIYDLTHQHYQTKQAETAGRFMLRHISRFIIRDINNSTYFARFVADGTLQLNNSRTN